MADDKSTTLLTQPQQIRVECLKIAYRHDRSPQDAVAKAEELEKYITGDADSSAPTDRQAEPDRPI